MFLLLLISRKQFCSSNEYKVTDNKKVEITSANDEEPMRELHDSSYQGVKRLFLLMIIQQMINDFSVDSFKKYFLPRVKIENYNIEIDGRNFYD